ncbi:MAG: hypothetical protein KJO25_07945 [Bacteroidia bacterium]|nr:hypothetical protein [Bacteroidia bacterium]
MLNTDRHRLIKRQLRKVNLPKIDSEEISRFLDMIEDAYKSYDQDIIRLETILEESSKELFRANQT